MENSKAYVGLTTPIGYDYETEPEFGYPNPVIEGSMGLFVLYDEIYFLHPNLCPKNMRDLEYIHFLIDKMDVDDYRERLSDYDPMEGLHHNYESFIDMSQQGEIVKTIAPTEQWDNHGRTILDSYMPMTRAPDNYILDSLISTRKA